MVAIYAAALVAGLALAAVEWAASPNSHAVVLACDIVAGWSLVVGSVVALGAVRTTRIPVLFLATGVAWFVGPALGPFQDLYVGPLAFLLVAYPTGRVPQPIQKVVVAAAQTTAVLTGVVLVTAAVPLIVAAAAVVAFLNGRHLSGPLRRGRRSAAVGAMVIVVAMTCAGVASAQGLITADVARAVTSLAIAASALWLAVDLRWGGWVHDALTRLVIELGAAEPTSVRDMFRKALDDDSLVLGYALDGRPGFVDEHGEPIALPGPSSGRESIPLISGGEETGILVRSAGVETDPTLADGVAAAAALAVGNARLHAAIGRQLADLSASRERLVGAVDAQRVRLQIDVAERIAPRLAGVADAIPSTMGPDGERLRAEVAAIAAQLRDLAAGIGPTDVAIHGLPHAIRSLADQCPIPVSVFVDAPGISSDAAATMFFVAAEGLANASKHAQATHGWVDIHGTSDEVIVDVRDDGIGGAVIVPGSGLQGLSDRLRDRGGTLEIGRAVEGGVRLLARLPIQVRAQPSLITDLVPTA